MILEFLFCFGVIPLLMIALWLALQQHNLGTKHLEINIRKEKERETTPPPRRMTRSQSKSASPRRSTPAQLK